MKKLWNGNRSQLFLVGEGTDISFSGPGESMENQTNWWIWVDGRLFETGFETKQEAIDFVEKQIE